MRKKVTCSKQTKFWSLHCVQNPENLGYIYKFWTWNIKLRDDHKEKQMIILTIIKNKIKIYYRMRFWSLRHAK